jgi:hypothetical protein
MSRDIDKDVREPSPTTRSGVGQSVERLSIELRRPIESRGRTFQLRPSELATLRQVGTFRVVDARDLERFLYGGNRTAARQDLRSLTAQGLMRRHTIAVQRHGARLAVVSLTREGAAVARQSTADGQAIYDRFVKPREVPHDAALYRMYHAEAARIASAGGRVHRVVLDYELKRQVHHGLQAAGTHRAHAEAFREQVAAVHGLRIVDDTIQIPDLRLEYETPAGEAARVDLELATEHYKPSQLAAKAQAGFTIYAPASQAGRITAALDERSITAEILSL